MQNFHVASRLKYHVLSNGVNCFCCKSNIIYKKMDKTIHGNCACILHSTFIFSIYDSTYRKTKWNIRRIVKNWSRNIIKILHIICICMYMTSAFEGHGRKYEPVRIYACCTYRYKQAYMLHLYIQRIKYWMVEIPPTGGVVSVFRTITYCTCSRIFCSSQSSTRFPELKKTLLSICSIEDWPGFAVLCIWMERESLYLFCVISICKIKKSRTYRNTSYEIQFSTYTV